MLAGGEGKIGQMVETKKKHEARKTKKRKKKVERREDGESGLKMRRKLHRK